MRKKLKILLLADPLANTTQWIYGLENFGNAEVVNLHLVNKGKFKRSLEWLRMLLTIKKKVRFIDPDIVIGYRLTSYGFLAAWSGHKPCVIATQGITDIWPEDHWATGIKTWLAKYAVKHASLIQLWGAHMAPSVIELGCDPKKLFIMPRGVDTNLFSTVNTQKNYIETQSWLCVVTRGLYPEYGHLIILKAIKKTD